MQAIVLLIHLFLAIALVCVVLLQRSEGGALGMGGGSMGGLMTTRGSANLLTRATAIIAGCFILTSLVLAIMAGAGRTERSILDTGPMAPPGPTVPAQPAKPAGPSVPLAK